MKDVKKAEPEKNDAVDRRDHDSLQQEQDGKPTEEEKRIPQCCVHGVPCPLSAIPDDNDSDAGEVKYILDLMMGEDVAAESTSQANNQADDGNSEYQLPDGIPFGGASSESTAIPTSEGSVVFESSSAKVFRHFYIGCMTAEQAEEKLKEDRSKWLALYHRVPVRFAPVLPLMLIMRHPSTQNTHHARVTGISGTGGEINVELEAPRNNEDRNK